MENNIGPVGLGAIILRFYIIADHLFFGQSWFTGPLNYELFESQFIFWYESGLQVFEYKYLKTAYESFEPRVIWSGI